MVVRIVTDSGVDLPEAMIKDLGVVIVPLHVLVGEKDYRDGVDIKHDQLYQIIEGPVTPTTSTASPGEFNNVFRELAKEGADGIICINISEKLSKTYGSAVQAKEIFETIHGKTCPIEVIDSEVLTMGMGFLVIMAVRLAKEGKGLSEIADAVRKNIPRIHVVGALETLKYLVKGGRAPKIALVAGPLKIKTFVKLADGELHLMGVTRTQQQKMEKLIGCVKQFSEDGLEAVAVEYSTNREEVELLQGEIGKIFPQTPIYFSRLGAALGVHAGPGATVVSVKTKT